MRDVEAVVSSWKKCWYERLSKQSCVRYHQCRTRCKKRSRPAVHNCTRRCASGRRTRHKSEIAQKDEDILQLSRMFDKACPFVASPTDTKTHDARARDSSEPKTRQTRPKCRPDSNVMQQCRRQRLCCLRRGSCARRYRKNCSASSGAAKLGTIASLM